MNISTTYRALILSVLCSIFASKASAQPAWGWIADSAITYFSEKDIEMIKSASRDVLNNHPDDTKVDWNNSDTGNSGTVKVVNTHMMKGRTCRNLIIKNKAKNAEGTIKHILCQQEGGTWAITFPD